MFRRPFVVRRRGMPLLTTAVVGGVAYAAGNRTARNAAREASQEQRISGLEQQQMMDAQPVYQQAPPPPVYQQASPPALTPSSQGMSSDTIGLLKRLGELHESGVLTDAEFETQKQRLLGNN